MLLEVLHLSGGEARSHTVHSHVDDQLLVRVQEIGQGVEGLLSDRVEADVDDLELLEDLEIVEQLDCSIVGDAALLEAKLLKLIAKRSGCGNHLGPVVLDEGVAHVD